MDTLKVLDLFSGIGGFSLGLERTGSFETVSFCEKDEHCQKVLRKNWPNENIPIFNNISNLNNLKSLTGVFNELYDLNMDISFGPTKIDVICGGFPCQNISVSGLKEGFIDENGNTTRSGLWFEYRRLISEVHPKWVIVENVRNLLNLGFTRVLKDLYEIGYDVEWRVISAREVGSCHLRERVWIVAYPSNTQRIGQQGCQHETWEGRNTSRLEKEISQRFGATTPNPPTPRIFTPDFAPISDFWKTESKFYRVDDGVSSGLDKVRGSNKKRAERVKQLGNSVVPQIVEAIGYQIVKEEKRIDDLLKSKI